mmetsp:Transcript_32840/g.49534  ORF Transcript_32840/g.49534 Transcript_32840/m.49534 type:complete len:226 (+) Transcript_32840:220-897(+)|eukprot:CAMPEP_0178925132 /NCGR_PEP_ID=MMETSP0786-20121207/17732_1 /TAXON_ID=186022 /ORGANISM="Thalassionema frauenfeldii, Strain CCMP 1798" /LENGTH=225 /DNA_ID=CAMNT_0020599959 /DNA_START=185 /DNA_END=862 /DNA_ORIENTATION=+
MRIASVALLSLLMTILNPVTIAFTLSASVSKSRFSTSSSGATFNESKLSTALNYLAFPLEDAAESVAASSLNLPELGANGLYSIETENQLKALINTYPDKLIVIKVFAPWCKACQAVATKYIGINKDKKYDDLPIVWAEMTVAGNKDYFKRMGVFALPSVLFYAGSEGMVENFPCGPSKMPVLKEKLNQFVNNRVDPKTRELKLAIQPSNIITGDSSCSEGTFGP